MEKEASNSDKQIAQVGHEENRVMLVPVTVRKAFVGQVHEEDIGEAIHNLCRVNRRIIVLSRQVSEYVHQVHSHMSEAAWLCEGRSPQGILTALEHQTKTFPPLLNSDSIFPASVVFNPTFQSANLLSTD